MKKIRKVIKIVITIFVLILSIAIFSFIPIVCWILILILLKFFKKYLKKRKSQTDVGSTTVINNYVNLQDVVPKTEDTSVDNKSKCKDVVVNQQSKDKVINDIKCDINTDPYTVSRKE